MKVATWNVNSIRARLPRVLAWLDAARPDVALLQETKVSAEQFPYLATQRLADDAWATVLPLPGSGRSQHLGQPVEGGVAQLRGGEQTRLA